jgi:hypothetical protein
MSDHRHVIGGPCPTCGPLITEWERLAAADRRRKLLAALTDERFSGPVQPRWLDPLTPQDHAELARRWALLDEIPVDDDEPA